MISFIVMNFVLRNKTIFSDVLIMKCKKFAFREIRVMFMYMRHRGKLLQTTLLSSFTLSKKMTRVCFCFLWFLSKRFCVSYGGSIGYIVAFKRNFFIMYTFFCTLTTLIPRAVVIKYTMRHFCFFKCN